MPTYDGTSRFWHDWNDLTPEQQALFKKAVRQLVADLKAKRPFRPGLRVKSYQKRAGAFEMTWAKDGRALFEYGTPRQTGEVHITWLRVGTHDIFEGE